MIKEDFCRKLLQSGKVLEREGNVLVPTQEVKSLVTVRLELLPVPCKDWKSSEVQYVFLRLIRNFSISCCNKRFTLCSWLSRAIFDLQGGEGQVLCLEVHHRIESGSRSCCWVDGSSILFQNLHEDILPVISWVLAHPTGPSLAKAHFDTLYATQFNWDFRSCHC